MTPLDIATVSTLLEILASRRPTVLAGAGGDPVSTLLEILERCMLYEHLEEAH